MTVCDFYKIVKDFQLVKIVDINTPTNELYRGIFKNVPDRLINLYIGHIEIETCKCCGTQFIKIYV